MRRNGNNINGNVMDQIWNNTTVRISGNIVVKLRCPWYEEIFIDGNKRGRYCVADTKRVGKVFMFGYCTSFSQLIHKGKFRYMFRQLLMPNNGNTDNYF